MDAPSPYHPPVKRSLSISGHQTSISLEPLFWEMLKAAAARQGLAVAALVARIAKLGPTFVKLGQVMASHARVDHERGVFAAAREFGRAFGIDGPGVEEVEVAAGGLAGGDQVARGGVAVEHHRNLSAHHLCQCGWRALKRHMLQIKTGFLVQDHAGVMRDGACAVRGKTGFALVGLDILDETIQILGAGLCVGDQDKTASGHFSHRHQGLQGIEGDFDGMWNFRDHAADVHHQGVAISR